MLPFSHVQQIRGWAQCIPIIRSPKVGTEIFVVLGLAPCMSHMYANTKCTQGFRLWPTFVIFGPSPPFFKVMFALE